MGFGTFASPDTELLEMAHSSDRGAWFHGIGDVYIARSHIDGTDEVLLLARTVEEFSADEIAFVRAVGRVIGLSGRPANGATRLAGFVDVPSSSTQPLR